MTYVQTVFLYLLIYFHLFLYSAHQDGQLTLAEILNKMDYIKTSTITDYGGMMVDDDHDEL